MARGAVSIAILAFLPSALLLLSSVPTVASSNSSPSPLIKDLCHSAVENYGTFDLKTCLETLGFERRIAAAKDLVSISIALLEAGISHATETRSYIQKTLKHPGLKPDYLYALQHCDSGYNEFVLSFGRALDEAKEYKDYDAASYDIKVGFTDNIDQCRSALRSKKVKDAEISKGNGLTYVFGEIAFDTANRIHSGHHPW